MILLTSWWEAGRKPLSPTTLYKWINGLNLHLVTNFHQFNCQFIMQAGKILHQICMTRSTLHQWLTSRKNVSFGNIPIAERYVKRIIENSPTLPKFQFTWNFSLLFNYFHNMLEIQALDINPEAGHVDDKYLRWSEGANHL